MELRGAFTFLVSGLRAEFGARQKENYKKLGRESRERPRTVSGEALGVAQRSPSGCGSPDAY